jgi:hypothetical protein
MLDTATAAPFSTSPEAESPDWVGGSRASPARVERLVCSQADHDDLKDLARSWLEYRTHWPEQLPAWLSALTADDQRLLGGWLASKRPWPGTTLLIGECRDCNSTLAVCADCRDEGVIERGNGPGAYEEQCSCQDVAA